MKTEPPEFVKPDECPACFYEMQCATSVSPGHPKARPKPDDLTVCINCGAFLKYNATLDLELLNDDDFAGLHPENQAVLNACRSHILQRNKSGNRPDKSKTNLGYR